MRDMEGIIFFAAAFEEQVKQSTDRTGLDTRAVLIGATIVLAIGFALFLWVYLRSRKKSDEQDRERLSQLAQSIRPGSGSGDGKKSGARHRRRKRRRVREHRPRNPSLDKTGGLPPPRPDDQLPKW